MPVSWEWLAFVSELGESDEANVQSQLSSKAMLLLACTCDPFNSEQMSERMCYKCVPLPIKVSLNPLPAHSLSHFSMTLSPAQWRCCCPKLLLLKANRTRTALLCQGCRSRPGHRCLTFFGDVMASVAVMSLQCPKIICTAQERNRRKLGDLGGRYHWFVYNMHV